MSVGPTFRAGLVASLIATMCCGVAAAEPLPRFHCYRMVSDAKVDQAVTLTDQFGQIEMSIDRLYRICNPTDANDQDPGAVGRTEHLTEYALHPLNGYIPPRQISVTNEFGTEVLATGHNPPPRSLLVHSTVSDTPPAPSPPAPGAVSHFTCYHVHRQPGRLIEEVDLEDETGTESFNTRRADELCIPAKMDDEDVVAGDKPLLCYVLRRLGDPPAARTVHASDEFGSSAVTLLTERKHRLCVPSTVVELP